MSTKSENYRVYSRKRHMDPEMQVLPMNVDDVIATSHREAKETVSDSEMEAVAATKAKPRSEQNY